MLSWLDEGVFDDQSRFTALRPDMTCFVDDWDIVNVDRFVDCPGGGGTSGPSFPRPQTGLIETLRYLSIGVVFEGKKCCASLVCL